jgi:4-hydroxy-3-polyprenylbenzoate decarboxylase
MANPPRIIVGISGASGAAYGIGCLKALKAAGVETHLIISKTAQITIAQETPFSPAEVIQMADVNHSPADLAASIASGSFKTAGMIVAPCSMRSLAEIAHGASTNLLTRAADVVLKERRKLVLMVRETPLTNAHLRNMLAVSEMGGIIAPPVPAFYSKPASLDDMVAHTVGRVLDLFDLPHTLVRRWGESPQ